MRKILIVLISLLLTACVDDTAAYYVDKSGNHSLTIHRAQKQFWNNEVSVELVMSRLPECQRRVVLTDMPADEVEIELLSAGDNVWTLRAGKELWQVETQTCTQYADVKGELGELLGVFRPEGDKLVFEAAVAAGSDNATPAAGADGAAPAANADGAAAPADAQPAAAAPAQAPAPAPAPASAQ